MSDSEHHQFHFDKARRSSILKPVKVDNRAPLQELGACSDETTATSSSIYKKRVSFHVINIKEFSSHAETQEVQKNPAYNEFLSSMSDSSRNNTNSECSNFSPMVPAQVIPQDEDKENQINYDYDSDSLVEDDTSEIMDLEDPPRMEQCNEPFDLSTRSKHEEPRNFLESTKLSHCNTIMSTFNISGIQNLDETSMRDLDDESDGDDSFQKMIDQQMGKKAGLNFYQYQRESMSNVAGENLSSGENMFVPSGGRKSFGRKSLAVQPVRHEDSDDNVELTCHLPSVQNIPNHKLPVQQAQENESGEEHGVAPPRRKSFAPRKSVNFKNKNLDSSGEMEFTCALPAMARPLVTEENDESEMEETETVPMNMEEREVFPRKSVGPCSASESRNVADKVDFMWRRSLPNKTNLTKSMDISNTSQPGLESRKSTGMYNLQNVFPQQGDNDSSDLEFTTFGSQKSLRKSVGRAMLKTSENQDESGMEMTLHDPTCTSFTSTSNEVLHGLPLKGSVEEIDSTSNEEYNVSISEYISDMEISNQSPPNITNSNQSLITVDQTKSNVSAVDFTIATSGPQDLGLKSMTPRIVSDGNNSHFNVNHLARCPTRTSVHQVDHMQHNSFSGFENSAMGLNTAVHRKSAPMSMISSLHNVSIKEKTVLNQSVSSLLQPTSEDALNSRPAIGIKPSCPNTSVTAGVPNVAPETCNSPMSVELPRTMVLNSSGHYQSMHTSYMTTDINSILPMAHSTNLNLSIDQKSTPAKTREGNSVIQFNTAKMSVEKTKSMNVISALNPNKLTVSMSMDCTLPQNTELVSNKIDNSNMYLSSIMNRKDTRGTNVEENITKETNIPQQPSESNQSNVNMSVNDISMPIEFRGDKSVVCEDMSLAKTITIRVSETSVRSAISLEAEVAITEQKNISIEISNNASRDDSDSAVIMSSSSGGSKDNSVVKQVESVLSEEKSGEQLDNEQLDDPNKTKPENKISVTDKAESQIALQVLVDDGFSSTQNSRQSLESGVSPFSTSDVLDISKMSCDLVEVERHRKRPSDGFEVHEENLVQDENKMVLANPKKRSKTFEVDIEDAFKETDQVEISAENMAKKSPMTHGAKSQPVTVKSDGKSPSMITPGKSHMQLVQTPTLITNYTEAETNGKPFSFVTPATTPVVKSTPNKTPTFVAPDKFAIKKPQFLTPGKTPNKHPTFRTPGKTPIKTLATPGKTFTTEADVSFSNGSLTSSNMSTYVNPSSTLTDSVINNISDRELPIASTRKPTASEMKAKQLSASVSCSTPLLPNSCNKNLIVDRFFESINKKLTNPEGFVAPSKNIIKKLIMPQEKQNEAIQKEKTEDTSSSDGYPSNETNSPAQETQEASLENALLGITTTLKRTKEQLNMSEHNDLNSSNYIPEKQQRNNSLNTSQHNVIEDVSKDISVLDISGDVEKLIQIQTEFATTLNISDQQLIKSISENIQDNDQSKLCIISPNKSSGLKDISMISLQHDFDSPNKSGIQAVETEHYTQNEAIIHVPVENKSIDFSVSEEHFPEQKTYAEPENEDTNNTRLSEKHLDESTYMNDKSHNESINSIVAETSFNLRKKRKSRLSIVPKPCAVEPTRQTDTKRKTLKVAPKKSVMRQSSKDDSIEEVQDQAEQNILAEENRGNTEWKSKSLEPELWEFEFFFQGLIVLKIEFNPICENSLRLRRQEKSVKKITFQTNEEAPIKHTTSLPPISSVLSVCYSLLHSKYPQSLLSGMCTTSSDVLPLLQHVSPFITYLINFARSLQFCHLKYGMNLNGTTATIDIASWKSLEWSQVSVNLKDIHFITSNDIHVKKMFGKLTESDVRQQFPVFSTKDNPTFMRTFIENIYSSIEKFPAQQ
ncbi:hypothetical protein WDU94_013190 [Cyamophila willieti]